MFNNLSLAKSFSASQQFRETKVTKRLIHKSSRKFVYLAMQPIIAQIKSAPNSQVLAYRLLWQVNYLELFFQTTPPKSSKCVYCLPPVIRVITNDWQATFLKSKHTKSSYTPIQSSQERDLLQAFNLM